MMSDYIKREDAIRQIVKTSAQNELDIPAIGTVIYILSEMDSADVVEVVRKPIKGYEGHYEVDQFGRVYSVDRIVHVDDNGREYDKPLKGKRLKQSVHTKGYKTVPLTKDGKTTTHYVHRLVAEAFIPNPSNLPFINHKDEDRTNNFVENLEWCDVKYNNNYGTARERQANALRGRPLSEEHKEKIRQSNIGKHNKTERGKKNDER